MIRKNIIPINNSKQNNWNFRKVKMTFLISMEKKLIYWLQIFNQLQPMFISVEFNALI